jgi:hypothetical protein
MKDIMNRKPWLIGILLLLALLVACAPAKENSANHQTGIDIDTVIIYEREGGFTGISQEWVIHLDGTIEGPGEQQLTVPSEDVLELVETGVASDFESLAAETAEHDACCDQLTYTLTVVSDDEVWSLRTTDMAEQPQEVTELFIMAEALIAEAEPIP